MILPILNKGISRSLPAPIFMTILIGLIGIIVFIILFIKKQNSLAITALLVSGTVGNLLDRIIYWGVRDFIDIWLFNFPIFNIADIMITLWVITRIAVVMLEKKK